MLISEKLIYRGRVIKLNFEKVELANGVTCELEIIHHPGGVAVVALNSKQEICVLRQYHAAGGWLWELPAGKIEKEEAIELTAKRELIEEAGMRANRWNYLGKTFSSPGVFTEIIHLFLAEDLDSCAQSLDEEEVLQVHWFSLQKVLSMIQSGDIIDAKNVVGVLYLQQYLQAHGR